MTNSYFTYRLFTEEQCDQIFKLQNQGQWVSGGQTTVGLSSAVKKNQQLDFRSHTYERLFQIVSETVNTNPDFYVNIQPKMISPVTFSRMEAGDYYNSHVDNWANGAFSTTVFLEAPENYEGGELCLLIDNKELPFKLQKGWAVTYKTGITHRVNPVESGTRSVAVFWAQSLTQNEEIREVIKRLMQALKLHPEGNLDTAYPTLEEAHNSIPFLIASSVEMLRRQFYT